MLLYSVVRFFSARHREHWIVDIDGSEYPLTDDSRSYRALADGARVVRRSYGQDIHEYTVAPFGGTWLLDGCPISVLLTGRMEPGMSELFRQAGMDCHYDES